MSRSRSFVYTDHKCVEYKELPKGVRFIAWGLETCPSTGKKHHQGFVQFEQQKTIRAAAKALGKAHVEVMRGNFEQNQQYCSKEGELTKLGEFKKKGQRSDIMEVKKMIDEGAPLQECFEEHFATCRNSFNYMRIYKNGLQRKKAKKFRRLEVTVYWGPTGTGKTKKAVEENPGAFKIQGDNLKWFDGYDGEDVLIIDEYDSQMSLTNMLSILDGYELRLPVKGGFTYALWTKVFMTSNVDPALWHPQAKFQHREALLRRINNIILLD